MTSVERHDMNRTGLALALIAALEPRLPSVPIGVGAMAQALRSVAKPGSDEARARHAALAAQVAGCVMTRAQLLLGHGVGCNAAVIDRPGTGVPAVEAALDGTQAGQRDGTLGTPRIIARHAARLRARANSRRRFRPSAALVSG